MRNNIRVDFSIPKTTLVLLDAYALRTMIPKSRVIGKLLKDFLEKENKKEALIK